MTMHRGRCMNVKLCSMATSQRVVEVPQDEPFICPRCSSDLTTVVVRKSSGRLRAVQAAAVVLGVAGLGGKVYLDNRPQPPAPAAAEPAPAQLAAASVVARPVIQAAPSRVSVTPAFRLADAHGAASRLAAAYLALSGDTDIHVQPGLQANSIDFVGSAAGHTDAIAVSHAESASARDAVAQGQADLALVAAAPGEPAVATYAAAIIVNPGNPIASLSRGQLQAIFSGKIRNWSELGAPAGAIHAFVAEPHGADSSASLLFADAAQPSAATKTADDTAVLAEVVNDSDSIGIVATSGTSQGHIVPVALDGHAPSLPTPATIADGTYALTGHLTLLAGRALSPAAARFQTYAQSATAQIAIQAAGLLAAALPSSPPPTQSTAVASLQTSPVSVSVTPAMSPAPDRFKRFVAGATLLPVVFHFEPGSIQLDRGGYHDVDRLNAYLRAHRITGDKLILAGFSDNTGAQAVREAASQKRVAAVVAALARANVTPARAAGFGADVAVADDATQEGRDRNRRVEVYVAP